MLSFTAIYTDSDFPRYPFTLSKARLFFIKSYPSPINIVGTYLREPFVVLQILIWICSSGTVLCHVTIHSRILFAFSFSNFIHVIFPISFHVLVTTCIWNNLVFSICHLAFILQVLYMKNTLLTQTSWNSCLRHFRSRADFVTIYIIAC